MEECTACTMARRALRAPSTDTISEAGTTTSASPFWARDSRDSTGHRLICGGGEVGGGWGGGGGGWGGR
jgi:hypothetical protein